jgi:hypothetical protein
VFLPGPEIFRFKIEMVKVKVPLTDLEGLEEG